MEVRAGLQRRTWVRCLAEIIYSYSGASLSIETHSVDVNARRAWAAGLPHIPFSVGTSLDPSASAHIAWLQRALTVARESEFYQGEDPYRFLEHCMAHALSDVTIPFGFGIYAEAREYDAACTSAVRDQLDTLAEQYFALAPHIFDSVQPCWFTSESSQALYPEISWHVLGQSDIPMWRGFNPVDREIFCMPSVQEKAHLDGVGFPSQMRVCCTFDVYGDDAGDESDPREHWFTPLNYAAPVVDARMYEIKSFADYCWLLQRYPVYVEEWDADYSDWAPGKKLDLVLDWKKIADDYDAVSLSVRGALDAAYVPCETDAGVGILSGFTPGSALYFRSPKAYITKNNS